MAQIIIQIHFLPTQMLGGEYVGSISPLHSHSEIQDNGGFANFSMWMLQDPP